MSAMEIASTFCFENFKKTLDLAISRLNPQILFDSRILSEEAYLFFSFFSPPFISKTMKLKFWGIFKYHPL